CVTAPAAAVVAPTAQSLSRVATTLAPKPRLIRLRKASPRVLTRAGRASCASCFEARTTCDVQPVASGKAVLSDFICEKLGFAKTCAAASAKVTALVLVSVKLGMLTGLPVGVAAVSQSAAPRIWSVNLIAAKTWAMKPIGIV